jgi:hypothetical protein
MSDTPKTITREQLYEQLWKVPIVRIAAELGYSHPELAKICIELSIPRPTGGYWYRLQHGGTSEQVPLPPAPEGARREIPLGPRLNAPLPPEAPDYVEPPEKTPAANSHRKKSTKEKPSAVSEALPAAEEPPRQSETETQPGKGATPVRIAPKFPDVVEITREELFQHVWATPIHLLAEELGLSDVGLAKTCVQMEVPRPGRGYWARLDAGEPVEQIQLPAPSAEAVRKWTFNVAFNRRRRADWAPTNLTAQRKGRSLAPIALPAEQEPLHEIAERHRVALERAKPDDHGFVRLDVQTLFRCEVSCALAPRLVRAIHALVVELEKQRCRFVRGDKDSTNLSVAQSNERLTVHWRESLEEFEREPTVEDKRKPSWMWQLKEKRAAGQLTIEVCALGLRGQRSWTESETKPIEQVLARVVEKIAAAFEGLEAQRQREAEQERLRIENEKKRAERDAEREKERKEQERISRHENKLKEIAQGRRFNLGVAAQNWEDSERVLAFVNAVEKRWRGETTGALTPAQEQWLSWARDEAEKLAPWSDKYPDAESARICDPKTIAIGGPYPEMRKLKLHDFRGQDSKPQPSPYSQDYGYSRY